MFFLRKRLAAAFMGSGLAIAAMAPVAHAQSAAPATSAGYPRKAGEFAAAIVVDAKTGEEVYGFAADAKWSAASLTKLMAALVFLQYRPAWSTPVAMKRADEVGGARLRLNVGSRITVKDAFYSSLVGSANNATVAMARSTGYSTPGFVRRMNAKAKAMGMTRTAFVDPSGIDPNNISTARDLASLVSGAMAYRDIRGAMQSSSYAFTVIAPKMSKNIVNTNKLLGHLDGFSMVGGKTGYLEESQYNFAMQVRSKKTGNTYVVVVLGSPTKQGAFDSAEKLAAWAETAPKMVAKR